MKWKATHILKVPNLAPRRVMFSSGEYYTRAAWEDANPVGYDPDGPLWGEASVTPIGATEAGASITPLRTPVARLTSITIRRGGKSRTLIVTLLPGDLLEMREVGCPRSSARTLPLMDCWSRAGKLAALKLTAERKRNRAETRAAKGKT